MYSSSIAKLKVTINNTANSKYAILILATVAFCEALFFPIPPDLLLIPLALMNYKKAFYLALITTIFSVVGGTTGYALGSYFYEEWGQTILVWFGSEEHFSNFSRKYNEFGTIAVIMGGLTPIPYKIVAILSGSTAMPIFDFIWASIFSRGLRFFLLATLIYIFHEQANKLIKKFFPQLIILLTIAILTFLFIVEKFP